jgi:hypothetical protein
MNFHYLRLIVFEGIDSDNNQLGYVLSILIQNMVQISAFLHKIACGFTIKMRNLNRWWSSLSIFLDCRRSGIFQLWLRITIYVHWKKCMRRYSSYVTDLLLPGKTTNYCSSTWPMVGRFYNLTIHRQNLDDSCQIQESLLQSNIVGTAIARLWDITVLWCFLWFFGIITKQFPRKTLIFKDSLLYYLSSPTAIPKVISYFLFLPVHVCQTR